MRKWWVLLCLLCLTGCAQPQELSQAVEFRAALVQAGGCSFRCEVTADFAGSVEVFALDCRASGDGTTELVLVEPESLAGITATVSPGGGRITYDGMALDFGLLANGNVIPAAAPALAVDCWLREYIVSSGTEDSFRRVTYQKDFDEKALNVDTWFENGIPICAEVCYNGSRILKLLISDFAMN